MLGKSMDESKAEWVKEYAERALQRWRSQRGPLEVSAEYLLQLEDDLRIQYEDPLKRAFIEALWDEPAKASARQG